MSAPEDLIRKILLLERARGCDNSAVAGGLDRFFRTLQGASATLRPALKQRIDSLAGGYGRLAPAARRQWLEATLAALDGASSSAGGPRRKRATAVPAKGRSPTAAAPPAPAAARATGLDAPVTVLRGVKGGLATRFQKLGVRTVRDLLNLVPRRYNDFAHLKRIADLRPGEEATVRVRVWSADERSLGRFAKGTEATVGDQSGMMRVVWFNQPWVARQLRPNQEIVLAGKVTLFNDRPTFDNPEWEPWSEELIHTGRLVPVYPLTAGLSGRTVRRIMRDALAAYADKLEESLPPELLQRRRFPGLEVSIRAIHFPESMEEATQARDRLAFEELLAIQLAVLQRRRSFQQRAPALPLPLPDPTRDAFLESLPFALTRAQRRCLDELLRDLSRPLPMSRLLEGDVGSGKTVVAAAGLLAAAANGAQSVMMAPTEILAEQHFRTLCSVFGAEPHGAVVEAMVPALGRALRIALLTGSTRLGDRARVYAAMASGEIDVAVGTHALIQEDVAFARLGLAVVDEQHRFGVMQRAALRDKSDAAAHMLVMTATPIPRTLALTLYGDLDISVINEMPPGRKPVKTIWAPPSRRDWAYSFVRDQIAEGRQAFIICPLVEESESLQVKAATQEFERLRRDVFPDVRLELLHGRMPGREKDAVMRRFRDREADILVSTAVIEVGIDIPNATVMVIEGADRFGLAQLHQFRGRVGRSGDQAYCLLLADDPSDEAQERLRLMQTTSDGFKLAEADLQMRGPGEFFGTRQSGLPDLRFARLTDVELIEAARDEAARILDADPSLARPDHAALRTAVKRLEDRVTDELH